MKCSNENWHKNTVHEKQYTDKTRLFLFVCLFVVVVVVAVLNYSLIHLLSLVFLKIVFVCLLLLLLLFVFNLFIYWFLFIDLCIYLCCFCCCCCCFVSRNCEIGTYYWKNEYSKLHYRKFISESKIITGINRILSIHLTELLGFVVTILMKILRKAISQLSMN